MRWAPIVTHPAHERSDATVHSVAAFEQRRSRTAPKTTSARTEGGGTFSNILNERLRQSEDLRCLQLLREVERHGVGGDGRLVERGRGPGMQMSADFFRDPLVNLNEVLGRARGAGVAAGRDA